MKHFRFSQIKHKIANNPGLRSLKEIKEAGYRIVKERGGDRYFLAKKEDLKPLLVRLGDVVEVRRGITTGANEFFYLESQCNTSVQKGFLYVKNSAGWEGLIEENFLKPVIKSPRELNSIKVKPNELTHKIFMCHKSKSELKGTYALKYIIWGESKGFNKRPTCKVRTRWWDLGKRESGTSVWIYIVRDRMFSPFNPQKIILDCNLFEIYNKVDSLLLAYSLNTSVTIFFWEIYARSYGGGGGPLKSQIYEVKDFIVPNPNILISIKSPKYQESFLERKVENIFTELGINPNLPIREQPPNPLPDRKALDDIIFDILGLTEEERKEVYWVVCELVKNRLEKARSV